MLYGPVRRAMELALCALLPAVVAAQSAQADDSVYDSVYDSYYDRNIDVDLVAGNLENAEGADQATLALMQDAERYRRTVQDLEFGGGAWSANLSEELLGFGSVLQRQGEHEQAIEIFDRAAHLARVNAGLDALEQIPALQGRILSHIALGDWEEADRQQQYAYYVHTRAMDRSDPGLVDALAEYARWSLTSYFRGFGEFPHVRLVDAFRLYSAAHALAAEHYHDSPDVQMAYLNDLAGTAYLVARTNAVQIANAQPNARGFNELAAVDASVLDAYRYRSSGFNQGENALIKAIDLQAGLTGEKYSSLNHAEAIAMLADWYLLFERRQAAMRHYREAWQVLAEESPEQASEFFARVQLLPQFSNFGEQRRVAAGSRRLRPLERGYADLKFDVSQYGRLSNVDVIAMEPLDEERRVNRMIRELRQSVMRPRFENGQAVEMNGVSMRVPYRY